MHNTLSVIPNAAQLYLVPVFLQAGGDDKGLSIAATGIRAHGLRIIARVDGARIYDWVHYTENIAQILDTLPEMFRASAERQLQNLQANRPPLVLNSGKDKIAFSKPLIMGVLNVTPDSFSDGGDYFGTDDAIKRAHEMVKQGADLIDVGGESTRPGAAPVWEGEEAQRVIPVIRALAQSGVMVSVDTRHSTVMAQALEAGAAIINDVSALTYDKASMDVAMACDAPVILMHAQGKPDTMQDNPHYNDVLFDVYDYLENRMQDCIDAGIDKSRIILDPGIGFGKRVVQDNLSLLNGLPLLHNLGCPVLIGASRKRFIGAITGIENAQDRMPGSITAAIKAMQSGIQIIRVHDVAATKQAADCLQAFHDADVIDLPKA